jgi:hypothetical protein
MNRAIVALTLVGLFAAATSEAQPAEPPTSHWKRNGCSEPVTRAEYREQVRRVWRFSHVDGDFRAQPVKRGRLKLERRRECAFSEPAHRKMTGYTSRRVALWRWHRRIDAITPYGKWAIPPYIVYCESGGSWSAYNPSGASGPYQLLGWGAPMPANTAWARARHHEIAARVLRIQGLSAWVCA